MFASSVATWLAIASLALPPEAALAAARDRATLPADAAIRVRYLWLPGPADALAGQAAAVSFAVCSTSKEPNLDRQLPVAVRRDLLRIDLAALGWDARDYHTAVAGHPYSTYRNPLTVNAAWFTNQISDGVAGDAYYRLLYGRDRIPKNRDEFLKFWGVNRQRVLAASRELGLWIEGESGVSANPDRVRIMKGYPAETGYLWETQDVIDLDRANDPLTNVGREITPDGSEWIASVPKFSTRLDLRGVAQAYLLSNRAGDRVEAAPTSLVEDHTRASGYAEIRNPVSCHVCHATGLNRPSENAFKRLIAEGGEAYATSPEKRDELERWLASIDKSIKRSEEDFAAFVKACNGLEPGDNAAGYQKLLDDYRRNVDRATAARELGCAEATLTLALARAGDRGIDVGPRLVALGQGGSIPRGVWEQEFVRVLALIAEEDRP